MLSISVASVTSLGVNCCRCYNTTHNCCDCDSIVTEFVTWILGTTHAWQLNIVSFISCVARLLVTALYICIYYIPHPSPGKEILNG